MILSGKKKKDKSVFDSLNLTIKTFPEGWEVIHVDLDNFEEYLEKLYRPQLYSELPKTLIKSMLNIDNFWDHMDYSIVDDSVNKYIYDTIDIGTGKFIQKKKKKCALELYIFY